eukprot:TRINITY_DN16933_c0_g1_i1.p1 TRINITY_DN16933_c0_g1~~TRINITY_DN16933_c0_g1_i1.p1  ORF type:complete len:399 (-),score=49.23 TRINITY_DN16933_c0_g1_i1:161-1357(-)
MSAVMVTLLMLFTIATAATETSPHPYTSIKDNLATKQYATWVWNTYNLFEWDDELDRWTVGVTEKEKYYSFIKNEKFTDIYVQYEPEIFDTYVTTKEFLYYFNTQLNIAVHLLTSGNYMHQTAHEDYQDWLDFKDYIESYNIQLADDATISASDEKYYKFTGIHVDNEPYMHDDWPTEADGGNGDDSDVKAFQDFHITVRTFAHDNGLIFGTDVSDGFEWINYNSDTYGEGVLADWFAKEMDFIVVMSYRLRTDLAIEASQYEVWKGDGANCTFSTKSLPTAITEQKRYRRSNGCAGVMWSLETDDQTWGEYFVSRGIVISFYGRPRSELNNAIATISEYYKDIDYGGFAVHMLPTFYDMGGSKAYFPPPETGSAASTSFSGYYIVAVIAAMIAIGAM